ncbi:MAG TPA: tetraacyldisaccharide 4'-kinase [Longimicrobium sp.]|nr:tetraacyldisaccharide 4'-kinase [Longimicrobium sp.]
MSLHSFVTRWWAGEAGTAGTVLNAALLPAEWAFRGIVRARNAAFDRGVLRAEDAGVPVISVGNVGVGGAGKTPFAAWLVARLRGWGRTPGIALRGYGDDEVILHRELNPGVRVATAARRVEAARELAAAGCDVVVLDDAFQHRRLKRDADIVLVAVETWERHPRLLPRGPWREGLAALARADAIVLTRKSASAERAREVAAEVGSAAPGKPVAICHLAADGLVALHGGAAESLSSLAGCEVLAVAGLGMPRPFFDALRQAGAVVEEDAYPDHHPFTAADALRIVSRAAGRPVLITRKDAVKLRELIGPKPIVWVLEQAVRIESGGDALDAVLRRALAART